MSRGIQHNLGTLEEQLDKLEEIALDSDLQGNLGEFIDDLYLVREKSKLIREETEKDILWGHDFPLEYVCEKFLNFLINESQKKGLHLSLVTYHSGNLPKSIIEKIISTVESVLNFCIQRLLNEGVKNRLEKGKLSTGTILLHFINDGDFFQIKIMDDGPFSSEDSVKKNLNIPELAALPSFCSLEQSKNYGLNFDLKIPIPKIRSLAYIFDYKNAFFSIISTAVLKKFEGICMDDLIFNEQDSYFYFSFGEEKLRVCVLDTFSGIKNFTKDMLKNYNAYDFYLFIIGSVDYKVAVVFDSFPEKKRIRIKFVRNFISPKSWHKNFALFSYQRSIRAAPLLDHQSIFNYCKEEGV